MLQCNWRVTSATQAWLSGGGLRRRPHGQIVCLPGVSVAVMLRSVVYGGEPLASLSKEKLVGLMISQPGSEGACGKSRL